MLAPHPDDELACAGTLIRMARAGVTVKIVYLSHCGESLPVNWDFNTRALEASAACEKMGIRGHEVWSYRVRQFEADRQQLLQRLINLKNAMEPELVLIPSMSDMHQDHQTTHREALRAFKDTSIFGYEMAQNQIVTGNTAFVLLTSWLLDTKIEAMSLYKSQINKKYLQADFLTGLARVRGLQAGWEFAEAFEVIRLLF